MSIWQIPSSPVTQAELLNVVPEEVLAEFDSPLTFSFRSVQGRLMLGHLSALGTGVSRYLVSPTSDRIIRKLKNGMLSIRSALDRGEMRIVDVDSSGDVVATWPTRVQDLPEDAIPAADVLLTPELELTHQSDQNLARFAKSDSDCEIALDGRPVQGYSIDLAFYGKLCQATSELFSGICQAMGIAPTTLRAGMTRRSSYAVDLNIDPPLEDATPEWFGSAIGDGLKTPTADELEAAFEQTISVLVDDQLSPRVVQLMQKNQKLRRKYGDVLEILSREGASLTARTRSQPNLRSIAASRAETRLAQVRKLGYPFMFLPIRGHLIGGSVEKVGNVEPRFAIRVDETSTSEVYKGRIASEAIEKMTRVKLGQMVDAKLQIEEEAGKEQTFTLIDVDPSQMVGDTSTSSLPPP